MTTQHIPVLLQAALNTLKPKSGGCYLDATLGGGGHAQAILSALSHIGTLVCIDQDPLAINNFAKMVQDQKFIATFTHDFPEISAKAEVYSTNRLNVILVTGNFRNWQVIHKKIGLPCLQGIIADLGLSTDQILDPARGFSFLHDSELDMRMNKNLSVTAKDLLNGLYKKELVNLFSKLGDVAFANELSNLIIEERKQKPIIFTKQLTSLVQKIVPYKSRKGTNKHPEAKVFQALRIAVNDELNALRDFLPQAFETLCPKGTLTIISFHSGEDRIVKNYFKDQVAKGKANNVERLLLPTTAEIASNPRSGSAKLRALSKI